MNPMDQASQSSLTTISMASTLASAFTRARLNIAFPLPLLTTSVINGLRYTLAL